MKTKISIVLALILATCAAAQNAGDTGTQTYAVQAKYDGTTHISQIFKNINQAAHWLTYCPVDSGGGYAGRIDIEQSFDGLTNWTIIALADYTSSALHKCAFLQTGGYFQNIRSVESGTIGSGVTAYYSASSGPISLVTSGISAQGPSTPVTCNGNLTSTSIANASSYQFLSVTSASGATNIVICALSVAGTGTGFVTFETSSNSSCTSPTPWWSANVGNAGGGVGQLFNAPISGGSTGWFCFLNSTGQNAIVSISYAIIPSSF